MRSDCFTSLTFRRPNLIYNVPFICCILLFAVQSVSAQQDQVATEPTSIYAFLGQFTKASLPLEIHPPVEKHMRAPFAAYIDSTYFYPVDLGRNTDIAPAHLIKSHAAFEMVTVRVSNETEQATYLVTYTNAGAPVAALRIGAFIKDAESTYQQWATIEQDLTINQQAMYRFVETDGEELACTLTTEKHKVEPNGTISRIQEEQVNDCSM
ncbi:MAG: hypothetical protein AAF564_21160 [Bacteroidota bacterium]